MTFGDYEADDAYDTEPADPEQVARKLQQLRIDYRLEPQGRPWEVLTEDGRARRIAVATRLLEWLRRQGSAP